MQKRYRTLAADYALAALAQGPIVAKMVRSRRGFYFNGRRFNVKTILDLIVAGKAVRVGDEIRRAP